MDTFLGLITIFVLDFTYMRCQSIGCITKNIRHWENRNAQDFYADQVDYMKLAKVINGFKNGKIFNSHGTLATRRLFFGCDAPYALSSRCQSIGNLCNWHKTQTWYDICGFLLLIADLGNWYWLNTFVFGLVVRSLLPVFHFGFALIYSFFHL